MARGAVALICWLAFAANVAAESDEPIDAVELEMLGAAGTVHQVRIVSTADSGITICSAGHDGVAGPFGGLARWFHEPLLTYHSREVGQIAIVQYYEGGGTGYSRKRYFAFCCTEHGCQVLHRGFAQHSEVCFIAPDISFMIESEFRAVRDGFSQLVRLDLPVQTDWEQNRIRNDGFGAIELRFRIESGDEGLVTVREIDSNSARVLLDIVELGMSAPQEWAAGVLEEQWPELEEPLTEYFDCPPSEQAEQMQALRARLDEILAEVDE